MVNVTANPIAKVTSFGCAVIVLNSFSFNDFNIEIGVDKVSIKEISIE